MDAAKNTESERALLLMQEWNKARIYGFGKSTLFSSSQSADDFASHWVLSRLEGRTSRLSQEFIEYLRLDSGRKKSTNYEARKNLSRAISIFKPIRIKGFDEGNAKCINDTLACTEKSYENIRKLLIPLKEREREILVFYYISGYKMEEIGKLYGLTEARVSQIINNALIKARKNMEVKPYPIQNTMAPERTEEVISALPGLKDMSLAPPEITKNHEEQVDQTAVGFNLCDDCVAARARFVQNMRSVLILKFNLSNRETEVIELVSKGKKNSVVADELFVTEKTVKFHLTNIYKKMKVSSRAQAMSCIEKMKAG